MRSSVLAMLGLLAATPAFASLPPGTLAPDFATKASLGGKEYNFHLQDALKQGPVVLYFYPAAFSPGCTVEAHDFAAAMPRFTALHATVIGVSMDKIAKLDRFSVSECRSKFPVASDADGKISHAYDSVLIGFLGYANRTSYVISPQGKVLSVYTAMNPSGHVDNTIAAVQAWDVAHPTGR